MRPIENRDYLPIFDDTPWEDKRKALLRLLEQHCYGVFPPAPREVRGEVLSVDPDAYGGLATEIRVLLHTDTPKGEYAFPVVLLVPNGRKTPPVFLHLSFRPQLPDRYVPVEEILDRGYALAVVCYNDITPDSLGGDFGAGLAAKLIGDDWRYGRKSDETGKIGVWAWGACRVLDWLVTCPEVDAGHTAVIGHSRLGKTALWAAANDTRFWCAISNDSGFGGAACARNGTGERVEDFIRVGSWDWFCERFKDDMGRENDRVYDQHMLLSLIAPRLLCVGSATLDPHADPDGEYLTSLAASPAWELCGKKGLVTPDHMPEAGDALNDGSIHYHLREGTHFLSRRDWNAYMAFLDRKLEKQD